MPSLNLPELSDAALSLVREGKVPSIRAVAAECYVSPTTVHRLTAPVGGLRKLAAQRYWVELRGSTLKQLGESWLSDRHAAAYALDPDHLYDVLPYVVDVVKPYVDNEEAIGIAAFTSAFVLEPDFLALGQASHSIRALDKVIVCAQRMTEGPRHVLAYPMVEPEKIAEMLQRIVPATSIGWDPTRAQLAKIGVELVRTGTFSETPMRAILEQAAVAPGSAYRFYSRHDLVRDVHVIYRDLLEAITTEQHRTDREFFRSFTDFQIRSTATNPGWARFVRPIRGSAIIDHVIAIFRSLALAGESLPAFRDVDPELAAMTFLGMNRWLLETTIATGSRNAADEIVARI